MEISKNKLIMIKENSFEYDNKFKSSTDAADFARNIIRLHEEPEEVLIMFALDSKNNIIGFCEVARGTLDKIDLTGREIYKRALVMNCPKIILAHNHPSGNPKPSIDDYKMTKKLIEVGSLLGIQLLDHIVIGDTEHHTIMDDIIAKGGF